jgi:SAM-dependent methyltransferase
VDLTTFVRRQLRRLDRNDSIRDAAVARWAATLAAESAVLDIGAASMKYGPLFGHCRYLAQDHPDVPYAPPGAEIIRSDITSIPLPDGSMDAVLCTEVLEHVEQPLAALDEIARLLRPGGQLLLSVPSACRVHRAPTHYYGGYAPDFFERSLPARGLRLDALDPIGNWSEYMAQEMGRIPDIIRHHSRFPSGVRDILATTAWPIFRLAVPLAFLAFSRFDASTDLPMGWLAYATRARDGSSSGG